MKNVTQDLITLLTSHDPVLAVDLYKFLLQDGTYLYYTTAEVPITWSGNTYLPSILFDRSKIDLKAGLEADSLTVNCYANITDLVEGVPFHQFLRQGGMDNAYLWLYRLYYPTNVGWFVTELFESGIFGTPLDLPPVGFVTLFSGPVGEIETGGLAAQLKIDSKLYALDLKLPKNLYQAPCRNILYDASCQVSRAACTFTGRVNTAYGAITTLNIPSDIAHGNPNYLDLGVLQFTSGALNGVKASISKQDTNGLIILTAPLPQPPANGDGLSVYLGCDRTFVACRDKFNNLARFRGQPWIPVPETTY